MKCAECGREAIRSDEDPDVWVHKDGRVKHAVVEETSMAPRTRVVPPEGEPYSPTIDPGDPEDASLLTTMVADDADDQREQAAETFDELEYDWGETEEPPGFMDDENSDAPAPSERSEESEERVESVTVDGVNIELGEEVENTAADKPKRAIFGAPKRDKMITVRGGGKYLKARDRIVWMRGEPEQHPDWTIDTIPEEIVRGTYKSKNEVEGGYARIRANVYDETGRLISSGTKTEFSERFMDFVEKAETGAIARALAVAGYGTEAALDLDEGLEAERIADAPVTSRPITISPSAVEGLVHGGRSERTTAAQLNEIERLAVRTEIGPNIIPLIENVCGVKVPDLSDNPGEVLREFLRSMTFEQSAALIQALNKIDAEG